MKSPGRRTFTVACALLLLMGVTHGVAQFTGRTTDPAGMAIEASMRGYHVPLGLGMSPSLLDLSDNLGFSVTIALLWLGLVGLAVATTDPSPRMLRRITIANLVGGAVLAVSQLHYRVAPPLVLLALILGVLVLSLVRQLAGNRAVAT